MHMLGADDARAFSSDHTRTNRRASTDGWLDTFSAISRQVLSWD